MNTKLFIDTTDRIVVHVELTYGKKSYQREEKNTSSQVLLLLIEKVLIDVGIGLNDIDEIHVNNGPGSYTGIRIGIAVAQTLGWLLKIPVNGKRNGIVIPDFGISDKFKKNYTPSS